MVSSSFFKVYRLQEQYLYHCKQLPDVSGSWTKFFMNQLPTAQNIVTSCYFKNFPLQDNDFIIAKKCLAFLGELFESRLGLNFS